VTVGTTSREQLRQACRLWGVQPEFTNADGEWVKASPETLRALLSAVSGVGAMVSTTDGDDGDDDDEGSTTLVDLIHLAYRARLDRAIEPVLVAWKDARSKSLPVDLPERALRAPLRWTIEREDGQVHQLESHGLQADRLFQFDGVLYARVHLPIPFDLPVGYHRVSCEIEEGREISSRLMCAPARMGASARTKASMRTWGLFSPLYAIRSERDWGLGSLVEMERTQEIARERGGSFFGTLPLLPIDCEGSEGGDPSPYSPVSRLFWNEIYLDVDRLVHESGSARAAGRLAQASFQDGLARLRKEDSVDYGAVFWAKKEILRILADEFFESGHERSPSFRAFLERGRIEPTEDMKGDAFLAEAYASFRARGDAGEIRYHLYVQYQMDRCLEQLKERVRGDELAGLYLDFPVGVNRDGFDGRVFASSFLNEVNVGAPPDPLFLGGQDWGFAPLHPIRTRENGYDYFIRCIRHHMRHASILRIDHIMAFHRLYAIPRGMSPREGAYLCYRPDEFYALLSIEAERAGVRVVGEDLGTVPPVVRDTLKKRGGLRMWVLPFEAGQCPKEAIRGTPVKSLACLNTHDMVPFAGYWAQRDLDILGQLGVLEEGDLERGVDLVMKMKKERRATLASWWKDLVESDDSDDEKPTEASISIGGAASAGASRLVFEKLIRFMSAGPAELVLVNLEDLWGETEPQNIPGTWKEYPNWRRKHRLFIEEWTRDEGIADLMKSIAKERISTSGTTMDRTPEADTSTSPIANGAGADADDDDPDAGRSPPL